MTATSPLKAIREKCIDCCVGDKAEVKLCTAEKCALYPFRFGKNPFAKSNRKPMSDEARQAFAQRMREARARKPDTDD